MRRLLPLFLSLCLAFPLTGHAEDDERPVVRLGLMAFTHEDSYTTHNQEDDFILKTPVFVKILQKNWLGVFLPLKNLSRGFAPTLRYPRIFF